ncbi:hypothetical protein ACWGNF_09905 [Streptomyces sp. NPDC055808]
MAAHEAMGATTMYRVRGTYCAALTLVVCAFSFGTETLAVGPQAGVVFVRSVLIWFGLALLSGRLLGQHLGWVIPLASAFALIWYPLNWWDWTANSPGDLFSWAVAGISLAIGTAATATTPWRRRDLWRERKASTREIKA